MNAGTKAGLSSVLAVVLCSMSAIGSPPSEFVQEENLWTSLEPLMWPCLFAGAALAFLALILVPFMTRGAAYACMAAASVSTLGVTFAWGVDAEAGLRGLVVPMALLAVPVLGAAESIRQGRREEMARRGAPLEERAG